MNDEQKAETGPDLGSIGAPLTPALSLRGFAIPILGEREGVFLPFDIKSRTTVPLRLRGEVR